MTRLSPDSWSAPVSVLLTVGHAAWWGSLSLAIAGLAFRSLVWASWVPYPNEPYRTSDILELLVLGVLLVLCGTCVLVGGLLVVTRRGGVRLLATGILVPVVYGILHPLLPTLRLW